MPSKLHFALATTAVIIVAACQPEPRLTSVNPLLQSEESRALRAAVNGTTIRWAPADEPGFKNCTTTQTFAKNGDLRRDTRCKTMSTVPALWKSDGAGGGTQTALGSWTVRDETVCLNYFSFEGVPTDGTLKSARCVPASMSGNSGIFAGVPVTVVARGS